VKLQDLLGMVLRIGNVMNEGTRTGGAAGFRFDSLLRLTQTKTSDGKVTVLDYLVMVFVSKGESDTLDLVADFPDCHQASRLLLSDMTSEVKLLGESLNQCKSELASMEEDEASLRQTNEKPATSSDNFLKRNQFLAAIAGTIGIQNINSNPTGSIDVVNHGESGRNEPPSFENTLSGGIKRLRNFVDTMEESFATLVRQRDEALEACKDLSRYCGESGGTGATTSLLDILSQFARNVEEALKKHLEQQQSDMRKQKALEAKELRPTTYVDASQMTKTNDKRSLVLLVNDVLKTANSQFKEDFKRGRMLPNPSDSLKAIYDREGESRSKDDRQLDIVSAIREREGNLNREALEKSSLDGFEPGGIKMPLPATAPVETGNDSMPEQPTKVSPEKMSVKERAKLLASAAQSGSEVFVPRPTSLLPKASPNIKREVDVGRTSLPSQDTQQSASAEIRQSDVMAQSSASSIQEEQPADSAHCSSLSMDVPAVTAVASDRLQPTGASDIQTVANNFASIQPSVILPLNDVGIKVAVSRNREDLGHSPIESPGMEAIGAMTDNGLSSVSLSHALTEVPRPNAPLEWTEVIGEMIKTGVYLLDEVKLSENSISMEDPLATIAPSGYDSGAAAQHSATLDAGVMINVSSSQERLRYRKSMSPRKSAGALADVMKVLEQISSLAAKPKRTNETPPIPARTPAKEKRSLSERAREKRDKNAAISTPTMTTPQQSVEDKSSLPDVFLTPSGDSVLSDRRSTIGIESGDRGPPTNESTTARLARKKRIQKRMSR
jgi:Formin Homology 2 Domain